MITSPLETWGVIEVSFIHHFFWSLIILFLLFSDYKHGSTVSSVFLCIFLFRLRLSVLLYIDRIQNVPDFLLNLLHVPFPMHIWHFLQFFIFADLLSLPLGLIRGGQILIVQILNRGSNSIFLFGQCMYLSLWGNKRTSLLNKKLTWMLTNGISKGYFIISAMSKVYITVMHMIHLLN